MSLFHGQLMFCARIPTGEMEKKGKERRPRSYPTGGVDIRVGKLYKSLGDKKNSSMKEATFGEALKRAVCLTECVQAEMPNCQPKTTVSKALPSNTLPPIYPSNHPSTRFQKFCAYVLNFRSKFNNTGFLT